MIGAKILNTDFRQEGLTLAVGAYTYSVTARPVTSTLSFRVGNSYYHITGLTPNELIDIEYTFNLETFATTFYPSVTIGDYVFEPQLERGTNASTKQSNPNDYDDLREEAGLTITSNMATIYAEKNDLNAAMVAMAEQIEIKATDLRTEFSSSITTKANEISLQVENLSDSIKNNLLSTGINIIDKKITITSNNTIFQSNNGALNALFSSNHAKIKADLIEFEGLVTTANNNFKILPDGSIEAKNGKFTGMVETDSGRIGGFHVVGQSLTNRSASGSFKTDATIIFRNDLEGTFAAMGGNVLPASSGLVGLARFENNKYNPFGNNYSLIVEATNADLFGNVAIHMSGGTISGLALKTRQISSATTLNHSDVYVSCYNTVTITVYLPYNPQVGKIIYIRRMNTASITINGNGKIIDYGTGTGSTKSVAGGIGDTHVLIFDGQYWNYNYMIRA